MPPSLCGPHEPAGGCTTPSFCSFSSGTLLGLFYTADISACRGLVNLPVTGAAGGQELDIWHTGGMRQ